MVLKLRFFDLHKRSKKKLPIYTQNIAIHFLNNGSLHSLLRKKTLSIIFHSCRLLDTASPCLPQPPPTANRLPLPYNALPYLILPAHPTLTLHPLTLHILPFPYKSSLSLVNPSLPYTSFLTYTSLPLL